MSAFGVLENKYHLCRTAAKGQNPHFTEGLLTPTEDGQAQLTDGLFNAHYGGRKQGNTLPDNRYRFS